jgi:hypothetical protein
MAPNEAETPTPDHISRGACRALAIVSIVLNLGIAALFVLDLMSAHERPMDYPFGAQNVGWTYRSLENYTVSGWAALAGLAAAIVATLVVRPNLPRLTFGFAPAPLLLLANMVLATS